MGTVMWRNTELEIWHLCLEAVKGYSLIKICNDQGKSNFPTFKGLEVQQNILLENSSNDYPKEFQANSQLKVFFKKKKSP